MDKNFSVILKEIQKKSSIRKDWKEEQFYEEIVRGNFIKYMSYESRDSYIKECSNVFQKSDLLIRGSIGERCERELCTLIKQVKERECRWGILVHPVGMWLINLDINSSRE